MTNGVTTMVTLIWAWCHQPRGGWNRSHDQVANIPKKILSIAALQKGGITIVFYSLALLAVLIDHIRPPYPTVPFVLSGE